MTNLKTFIILICFLSSCGSSSSSYNQIITPDSGHQINGHIGNFKFDSVLCTGWYCIRDTATGYKRQLGKVNEYYNIDPTPIVTTKNFIEITMFHEKDCYALFIWLDKKGSQALDSAMQKSKGGKFAFILNNKLLRTQLTNDPQFADVEKDVDPRMYGQTLTFPCNSFSPEEMKNYKSMIENEKK